MSRQSDVQGPSCTVLPSDHLVSVNESFSLRQEGTGGLRWSRPGDLCCGVNRSTFYGAG